MMKEKLPVIKRKSTIEYFDGYIEEIDGRKLGFFEYEGKWACCNPENGGVYFIGKESLEKAKDIITKKIRRRLMPDEEIEQRMKERFEELKKNIED